jgi:hypothetical protein
MLAEPLMRSTEILRRERRWIRLMAECLDARLRRVRLPGAQPRP